MESESPDSFRFFLTVNNFYILRVDLAETSVDPPPLLTESGWDGSS